MLSRAGSESKDPLRILIVINVAWNPHFGAVRIYMELAEQWRASGHIVEHFSLSDAFPKKEVSARRLAFQRTLFPKRAAEFVKKNADRFDVVDALIGSLSASKKRIGFKGLLVARSVGWHRSYDRFERSTPRRWPQQPTGTLLGRSFYSVIRRLTLAACDSSVRHADLVNVPNEEETAHVRGLNKAAAVIIRPYGLTTSYRQALSQFHRSPADKLRQKTVSFVGMWGLRKGSGDWGQIVRKIRQQIPDARFRFLGTMVDANKVLSDLNLQSSDGIEVVPEYSPPDLPKLLAGCAVGALPTYVEGFGLVILEQLAAGIPIVAFDAAGPHDILSRHLPELLVPIGDVDTLATTLTRILQLDPVDYERLVQKSRKIVDDFSWPAIAEETLRSYRAALDNCRTK